MQEIDTKDVNVDLVMLRCVPERDRVGAALLEALAELTLGKAPAKSDVAIVAHALPGRSVRFFAHQGFKTGDRYGDTARELLRGIYAHEREEFERTHNVTALQWGAEWRELVKEMGRAERQDDTEAKERIQACTGEANLI